MAAAIELQERINLSVGAETKDRRGVNLSLNRLIDSFFPESSFANRQEMENLVVQCNELLSQANETYFLSASNIIPFVKGGPSSLSEITARTHFEAENPLSQAFNLNMKLTEGPVLTFYVGHKKGFSGHGDLEVSSALLKALIERFPSSRVDPEEFGLESASDLFRIDGNEHMIGVKQIGNNSEYKASPFIIVQSSNSLVDSESVELKIAVETNSENENVRDYTPLRTLFTIRLKSLYIEDTEQIIFSDYYHSCNIAASVYAEETSWIFNGLDSQANISGDAINYLTSPVSIYNIREHMLNTHIPPMNHSYEREKRVRDYLPIYYLDLLLLSASLTKLALVNGQGTVSEDDMFGMSDDPVLGVLSSDTVTDFEFQFLALEKLFENTTNKIPLQFYSPLEFLLYENIWSGRNIWNDLDKFYLQLTEAVEKDAKNFWRFLITIGLDRVFPAFKEFGDNPDFDNLLSQFNQTPLGGMEAFCRAADATLPPDNPYKKKETETYFEYWFRLINLLPDISVTRDWRPGKENQQSDLYFMKLCKALGAFALLQNEELSGAILVKDGVITRQAINQINRYEIRRHRDQAIAVAIYGEYVDTADEELKDYTLYALIGPDLAEAQYIRNFELARICCGIPSVINKESALLLTSNLFTQFGFKPPPAEMIIGMPEMEAELFDFLWKLGFRNFPDYLVQKYVQIGQGGYDEKTAKNYINQSDEWIKTVGSIEQEMLLEWLGPDIKGKKILDAGCGPGNEAYLLGKQGADIEGIDGSEEMIRQAKERYPQLVDRFRIGNVTEFPYPDETFPEFPN